MSSLKGVKAQGKDTNEGNVEAVNLNLRNKSFNSACFGFLRVKGVISNPWAILGKCSFGKVN